jgi:hypothetical protein
VKRDVLRETDELLRRVDADLRDAQSVRTREAVDRLMESAAQGADSVHLMDMYWLEDLELDYNRWHVSVYGGPGFEGRRQCVDGACWDEEYREMLDCASAQIDTDYMDNWFITPGMFIPRTPDNLDVLRDPPDGVDPPSPARPMLT